jgi:hypothetical protein
VGDVIPPLTQQGEYVQVRDIAGVDMILSAMDDWHGQGDPQYGDNPSLLVAGQRQDGTKIWFIVAHEVLYRKLSAIRNDLPLVAQFFKPEGKRYFDVK